MKIKCAYNNQSTEPIKLEPLIIKHELWQPFLILIIYIITMTDKKIKNLLTLLALYKIHSLRALSWIDFPRFKEFRVCKVTALCGIYKTTNHILLYITGFRIKFSIWLIMLNLHILFLKFKFAGKNWKLQVFFWKFWMILLF